MVGTIYADHNVSRHIVEWLRQVGYTLITAREIGPDRAEDDLHLLVAAQRGWTLITSNTADYRLLHDAWRRWSAAWDVSSVHSGIVVFPQTWAHRLAAEELDAFFRGNPPLATALFEWFPARGWVHRPLRDARLP